MLKNKLLPLLRRAALLLLAWTAIPVLLLAGGEGLLRVSGYGHTTKPFERMSVAGRDYVVVNKAFFCQFMPMWPDSVAYEPYDLVIPVEKDKDVFRVAVLGSSAALGFLNPEYGFWRVLRTALQAQHPGMRFEVYCLGWNGMNSHIMRYMAEASTFLHFDAYTVYMGNNEVKGTLALMYDMNKRFPTYMAVRAYAWFSDLRLTQLLSRGAATIFGRPKNLRSWEADAGYSSVDDPRLLRVYQNYRDNVESICDSAERAGASVVLCTVGANLRTWRPGSDFAPQTPLSGEEQARRDKLFADGAAREEAGSYSDAAALYEQALALDAQSAGPHFRLATCRYALGEYDKAREEFERAHELDLTLIAAGKRVNTVIRETAERRKNEHVILVDTAERLAEHSPHGIPGDEFFTDHVHLTFEGNYELARAVAERMDPLLPPDALDNSAPLPSIEETKAFMGVTAVDLLHLNEASLEHCRFSNPPRPTEYFQGRKAALEAELAGKDREQVAREAFQGALKLNEHDVYVWLGYAELLFSTGKRDEAEALGRELVRRFTAQWRAHFVLARALENNGKTEEALAELRWLSNYYPPCAETYCSLGDMLARQNRPEEALAAYRRSASMKRSNSKPRLGEAGLLISKGQIRKGVNAYLQAMDADFDSFAPFEQMDAALKKAVSPGKRLAAWRKAAHRFGLEKHIPERLGAAAEAAADWDTALEAFRALVQQQNGSARAHAGLGQALLRKGLFPEAEASLRRALELDPAITAARPALVEALCGLGQFSAAREELDRCRAANEAVADGVVQQLSKALGQTP